MAGQFVKCGVCGKTFDISQGGAYDERQKRMICPACAKAAKPAKRALRPGIGGTVGKLIGALIFLAFAVDEGLQDLGSMLFGLALGLPLLLWAVLPWLNYWRDSKREKEMEDRVWEEKALLREQEENRPMICPSCGATSRGKVCEYCGTKLE